MSGLLWDKRGLRFHVRWTRDFIRDFGAGEYCRVVVRDANIYRLRIWRCWFGHRWGEAESEYEQHYLMAEYEKCGRPRCEAYRQTWSVYDRAPASTSGARRRTRKPEGGGS